MKLFLNLIPLSEFFKNRPLCHDIVLSSPLVVSHFICFTICQAFADLVIKVLDENDSPPQFKESSYEAAIAENSMAGKTVVPVSNK